MQNAIVKGYPYAGTVLVTSVGTRYYCRRRAVRRRRLSPTLKGEPGDGARHGRRLPKRTKPFSLGPMNASLNFW